MNRIHQHNRWRRIGVLLVALAALAAPAGPAAAQDPTPRVGGTLLFARNQEPESLNPLGPSDNGSIWVQMQIFDQLVELVPGNDEPQPSLAESWEVGPDGLSYTFHLRPATFSDGTMVTAEDVKFSIERFADPDKNTGYSNLAATVKSVTVVDPATVRVDLTQVDAMFLDVMSMFIASIVPQHVLEAVGENGFADQPVGSGPFKLASWTRGQELSLVRNEHYWKDGQPYLDAVTFRYVADDNARILTAQAGEVQVAESIPLAQVDQLDAADGLSVLVEPLVSIDSIYLNNSVAPLDDPAVRQALNYATPKEAIRDTVLFGKVDIANSMIPRTRFWTADVPAYPYDLATAQELMADSSVPDGFVLPLLVTAGDTIEQQTAAILQAEWKKIGVDVQVEQVDLGTLFDRYFGGEFTAATFPGNVITSDVLVDDELASIILDFDAGSSSFQTQYRNAEVSALIQQARGTLDQSVRADLFAQVQQMAMDDAPQVPLFFTPARTAVRDQVHGFQTLETGWWNLEDVWLSE